MGEPFQSPHNRHLGILTTLLAGGAEPREKIEDWRGLADAATYHGVEILIHHLWRNRPEATEKWPHWWREELERGYYQAASRECLIHRELARLSGALAAADVRFAFMKGVATGYSVYDLPFLRTRADADLVCRLSQRPRFEETVKLLGYREVVTSSSELLFGQSCYTLRDPLGAEHCLDVHWEISARKYVAKRVSAGIVLDNSVPLARVGPGALRTGDVQTLLIACVHPMAHHAEDVRLIWLYDVMLISSGFRPAQWQEFIHLARGAQLECPARQVLELSRSLLGAAVPEEVMEALGRPGEHSSWRTENRGKWRDLGWDLGNLGFLDRIRLLREVLFPRADYLFARYGVRRTPLTQVLLPLLHLRRLGGGALALLSR